MSKAIWTLMIYMAGDNSLTLAANDDVGEMRAVGSSDSVNIVVFYDGFGMAGAERGRLSKDGKGEEIESLKEVNSGDPETLVGFADWVAKRYPAERYGLILWSHGNGWQPYDLKQVAQTVHALNFDPQERSVAGLKRVLFRPTLEEILSLPETSERAICMDDLSGASLDTAVLGKALDDVTEKLGQKLEILGMDACLMSNFEVAFQVQAFAAYMVASEELEPEGGWSYEKILRRLVDKPDLPTQELAEHIVNTYARGGIKRGAKTLTAMRLAEVSTVAAQLARLADALEAQLPEGRRKLWAALQRAISFEQFTLWDIAHLCDELKQEKLGDDVIEAATQLRQMLAPKPDGFVIAHKSNSERLTACGGVSIYIPAPPEIGLSRFYSRVAFAKQTTWPKFLQALKEI
jgi:hypothetical protein